MTTEFDRRASELFENARPLSLDSRAAYLDRECNGDANLRDRVTALLEHDAQASLDGFLDASAAWRGESRVNSVINPAAGESGRDAAKSLADETFVTGESGFRFLLWQRMRVGWSIVFASFGVFLILDTFDRRFEEPGYQAAFASHCVVVAVALISTILLWKHSPGVARLRVLELVMVVVCAVFGSLYQTHEFEVLMKGPIWGSASEGDLVEQTADSAVLRWFAFIVCYGFFVPNTWARCGRIVVCIAICPIAVMILLGVREGTLGRLGLALIEMLLWLGIASAMAIYGSHKITQLRREASRLGQYRLKDKLGAGGMGEVYLADHARLRRPCAIKLIRPDRAAQGDALSSFEREVQATAALTHPNIVRIYDYGVTDDATSTFYYAMEYLDGLTLEQMVGQHGALPAARAVHYLLQVCSALREAHGVGLIHRDIKPGNVMACLLGGVKDQVKLLDFGLVENVTGADGSGVARRPERIAGTPAYMSPEQSAGLGALDARSDIYSLGAVGYFLLSGRPPFVRQSAEELLLAHFGQRVSPLNGEEIRVPADLEAVILRCLEKGPERRFPSAEALEEALARCDCARDWTEPDALQWWSEHSPRQEDCKVLGERGA